MVLGMLLSMGAAFGQQTSAVGAIAGHVTDARSVPVSSYSVLVFPTDRTKWSASTFHVTFGQPDADGGFEVGGLAPGEYWVAAINPVSENQNASEWQKPDVLERLAPRATRVTVADHERALMVLRLIRP